MEKEQFFTTKKVTTMAVMTAVSYVLYMFVKIQLPIFPAFLDIQISELPALIVGFMFGPIEGIIVILIKCLLKLPFTSTAGAGEFADFLMGIGYVVPAAVFYRFNKSRKGAAIGLCIGYFSTIIMAVAANYLLIIPYYVKTINGGWDTLIKMLRGLYEDITRENFFKYYLLYAIIPFNALRSLISGVLTFVLYKHLSRALKHLFLQNISKKVAEEVAEEKDIEKNEKEQLQVEPQSNSQADDNKD